MWVYVIGFFLVIVGVANNLLGSTIPTTTIVLAAVVAALVYGVVGWGVLRYLLKPSLTLDIYAGNDTQHWIKAIVTQIEGSCMIAVDGAPAHWV
jgi:hypothetical protein